ncbi:NAD(P)-dependent alcohol dehydrogenase [Bosea caraganae]|uniref:NAD(P)-dependent alcohol dehydrogenase n=1 Tax=Bosea caraganae TaxID=2763117 RepID=A0A370L9N9_9HYPH|nr:NAD(P)-dependent alcohol dehydrogenase [Bosea caraganae]RDJ22028.1 NAD(P)-dependent alcohol dehydrogenase [Bosea caraganae]RDJ27939.1 NAD(P)-dependent alcohol dehydrogenase [Bosea caraganae]
MREKMKAWQLAEWGKENLQVAERDVPRPGPNDVLVHVRAVSLNYRDKPALEGSVLLNETPLPYTPCSDMAGEVVEVGSDVQRWTTGDRVSANFYTRWVDGSATADLFGLSLDLPGTLAEYVLVPETAIVRAPDALSMEEIATLPVAAVTAWSALVTEGRLRAGQSVLLHGTGGVSLFGIQFARMFGARAIITSRSAEKLERAKLLGANDVIETSEYPNWAGRVMEITKGRGVDHIFETIGGENYKKSLDAAAIGARITTVGFLESSEFTLPIVPMIIRRIVIQGLSVGHRRSFEDMIAAIEINGLKPVIDRVYDWKDVPAAFDHLDRGAFGKIVVSVNP